MTGGKLSKAPHKRQDQFFQCTAEHLKAQIEGGKATKATKANIAAACWHCNQMRHRTTKPLEPAEFQKRAQRCVGKGGGFPGGLATKVARLSAHPSRTGGK